MIKLNTYKLQNELIKHLKAYNERIKILNTKQDMVYNSVKGNNLFLQYVGIDYKTDRRAVVKFVIYIVNKKIYNNDDSITKDLDIMRYAIKDINLLNSENCFLATDNQTNGIILLEEKYNNTDTLEFIYSLVFGINILI